MKRLWLSLLLASPSVFAVEGYPDIYLDREQAVNIHSIFCGINLKNLRALKPAYIYTNSEHIEKGTYYFNSIYGNYSYTFNTINGQDPTKILARALLSGGKTKKSDMKKEICIVGNIAGLPNALAQNLGKKSLSVESPEWDQTMVKYKMFGKPAFAKGIYQDQRTTAKYDALDQKVFAANQAYLAKTEKLFKIEFDKITEQLPEKLTNAIKYAYQEDGFLQAKTYPVIKEPTVWTAIAKERYNDQQRRLSQRKAWDIVIQKNFDWFFSLVGKDNSLEGTQVMVTAPATWDGQKLQQLATITAVFANGKTLELDFLVSSAKIPASVFDTMPEIKKQAHLIRNNPIASSKRPKEPIALPTADSLTVYTPTEKMVIFFSPFRDKSLGDGYRYQ